MTTSIEISESVRHYYGQVLQSSNDLKTSACCSIDAMPAYLKGLLAGAKIGMVKFSSVTVSAFKLPLEDSCEDYGQVAYYLGSIPEHPHIFELDNHHHFETGRPLRVCGNTADMQVASRYAEHFQVLGNKSRHFGLFDCTPGPQGDSAETGLCC